MEPDKKTENYEVAFLTKDENVVAVKKLVSKHGGEVAKEKAIEKIHIAYPIKKENYGFFSHLVFSMEPSATAGLRTDLDLEGSLLRYFFRRAKKPRPENEVREEGRPRSFLSFRSSAGKPAEKTLTNEALEKKIEEILQ
ncbi:MAG: 30S ribosomal protein S6 [Patescibacteria group bacterium]